MKLVGSCHVGIGLGGSLGGGERGLSYVGATLRRPGAELGSGLGTIRGLGSSYAEEFGGLHR